MDGRRDHGEPVAIIGMACRFPGARDPAEFHDLAVASRSVVGWVPRMRAAEEAGPAGAAPARAVRGAGAGNPSVR